MTSDWDSHLNQQGLIWRGGEGGQTDIYVGQTSVGLGVFAGRNFPIHAVIGEISGDVIDDPQYSSDYCFDLENGRHLEPHPPFRFVNHSCDPNCEFDWFGDGSENRLYLIALSDIFRGQELTIDYNWPADSAILCDCRSPLCRGWVVGIDELPDVADMRRRMSQRWQSGPAGPG